MMEPERRKAKITMTISPEQSNEETHERDERFNDVAALLGKVALLPAVRGEPTKEPNDTTDLAARS